MSDWISVETDMPPAEKKIIAAYTNSSGKNRNVMAYYAPRFAIESYPDGDAFDEYNEDDDLYYLKEGWYEMIDNWDDWSSVYICNGEVTHWMENPAGPIR